MADPWEHLQSTATEALNWLWDDLAKEGRESAVLAPLAAYSNAAAWLAGCMAMSDDAITRKLGAMLAGWIDSAEHVNLLSTLLDNERKVFIEDSLTANSVGEDIMFAASRWSQQMPGEVRDAGISVLAEMIRDALHGTPWNTVHWAAANLHVATGGRHAMLSELHDASDVQLEGQEFLRNVVAALRSGDHASLDRFVTPPNPMCEMSPNDPKYSAAQSLWAATAAAEASLH